MLKAQSISKDYAVLVKSTVTYMPASVTLSFNKISNTKSFRIYKKTKTSNTWGAPIANLPASATQYTDNAVSVGNAYEYHILRYDSISVAYGYIYVGLKLPETTYRGKLLLMVDANYVTPLLSEIKQLQNDLTADGWQVKRFDISRTASVKSVKTIITNEVAADANTKAVYLLGHIPVPYSGVFDTMQFYAPDGHWQHSGAWPADMYYGTLNESIWTDNLNDTIGTRTQNRNIAGDGKFDNLYLYPDTVALQVGRVDLTNMPTFGMSDTLLVQQYLNKAHQYKTAQITVARKGLVYDNFGAMGGEAFASNGWRDFTTMFGDSVFNRSYLSSIKQGSYLFSYGCGAGNYNSCQGIGFSNVFNNDSINTVFTMLFGSFFGDWDSQDNFLRAPLCSRPMALASMWSGRPQWHTHHMSLGENIGYSTRLTQNNYYDTTAGVIGYNYNIYPTFIHVALMGDPSLRLHAMKSVANVKATLQTDSIKIRVTWNTSVDGSDGYVVLRSSSASGKYLPIAKLTAVDSSFTDSMTYNGMNYYMVRSLKLEQTPSGTYYNMALGVIDSAASLKQHQGVNVLNLKPEVQIYPNPNKGKFVIFIENQTAEYTIECFDMTGKSINHISSTASSTELNLEGNKGLILVKIISGNTELTKKVLILD